MNGTTDEIKARLNIVEVVGSYVRLEKSGAHYKARCPFHQERSPSFMVNEERNMWHCFGCGKGGDIFAFVMEIETLDFREALVLLAGKAGVELPKYRSRAGEEKGGEEKERIYEILELATKFYEKQLSAQVGKHIQAYLADRGLSEESVTRFRLGYAPEGWRHLADFLLQKGYSASEMEKAGLIIRKDDGRGQSSHYDRFRDRIMFPISDILGRVIGYSARMAPGGDESQAKYINTPETQVYHKSRALYGLFHAKQAMKQSGITIVVEGNMDVIALHQAGVENTIAVSGTALTPEQVTIMKRYGGEVRLFFDMDGAGQKAARTSTLLALDFDLSVSLIALATGKDAAELGKENPEELKKSVEHPVPAPEYFLQKLLLVHDKETATGKRKIVEEFTDILVAVRNPIERAHFIRMAAGTLNLEEKTLSEVVNAAFLRRERREGPAPREQAPNLSFSKTAHIFHTRAERLREELIAILYGDPSLREMLLREIDTDLETLSFLEKHPLFFFVRQAGGKRDPLDLIEDGATKSQATRLAFGVLGTPAMEEMNEEERREALLSLSREYRLALHGELTKKERMRELEQALREARTKKDKTLEKKLLQEFVAISQTPGISQEEKNC